MPATSTLRQILIELTEQYGLGTVVALSSQTTTTLVLTTEGAPELRGPFSGRKFAIGSPVLITQETSGTDVLGDRTFVSNWEPSTGTITVSPAIGGTDGTEAIIFIPEVGDADRLIEAVKRALENRIGRWEPRPLTFVPDGDLQGATVTDYWTAAANGTAAYVTAQAFPAGSAADAFGETGVSRLVQLTTAGGSSTLTGNGIRWPVSTQQRSWYFRTAIRLVSGSGTAEFKVRDNTNAADITLQVSRGNDTGTLTTTTLGDFMVCEGTFQMPATCAEVAPQLSLSATGLVAQMAPVIMFPQGVTQFPLPNRIKSIEQVGNLFTAISLRGPGGLADDWQMATDYLPHRIYDFGDHFTLQVDASVTTPLWYEEYVHGAALSAMTDTTTFPLDRVVRWAYAELTDRLMRDEMLRRPRAENGTPLPSVWRPVRNAALKAAQYSHYEPQPRRIVGRR